MHGMAGQRHGIIVDDTVWGLQLNSFAFGSF